VVVNRAEDASGLDRHEAHPKLPPRHALDLPAEVEGREELLRHALRLGSSLIVAQGALLSVG
jgi:hypothetical protein